MYGVPLTPAQSCVFFFLMIRRPPRSTLDRSSAASDVYKRQVKEEVIEEPVVEETPVEGEVAAEGAEGAEASATTCLLYTSPSPRDRTRSRMPSSA